MSRILSYVRLALSLPLYEVADRLQRSFAERRQRGKDTRGATYLSGIPFPSSSLNSYVMPVPPGSLQPHAKTIRALATNYLHHRFDLLGSGWVHVRYGMRCAGVEGHLYEPDPMPVRDLDGGLLADRIRGPNRNEARRIRRLIDRDYEPIDWHLDFKSGYRWQEKSWYKGIRHGHERGADIKVPWELARMQHLTMLAWAYALSAGGIQGDASSEVRAQSDCRTDNPYARELRNQILDFIAANPPRFGVNWACTMDVAIRAVNWLLAYDLFTAYGARFEEDFLTVLVRSVYEHGLHIVGNLEFSKAFRGNHYLADVVGLLFISAYLPRHPQTDAWLAFAVQELISEVHHQFFPDGLNFEASVPYHRLSLEMVIYGTALVLGLGADRQAALRDYDHRLVRAKPGLRPGPGPLHGIPGSNGKSPFPAEYVLRLGKSVEATLSILRRDGHAPQIGDNDNGRFFKVHPAYRVMTVAEAEALYENLPKSSGLDGGVEHLDEDHLDHGHLLAALTGLYGAGFPAGDAVASFETELVSGLAGGSRMPWSGADRDPSRSLPENNRSVRGPGRRPVASPSKPAGLMEGLTSAVHADFGLYLFRSDRLHLCVRCGPNGQGGRGGHAHNDQLSLELSIDGALILVDAGTYCYTGLIDKRNLFRSTAMHNTLVSEGREQNSWLEGRRGVFRLPDQAGAEVEHFGLDLFAGRHSGFGPFHRRSITIRDDGIQGLDELDAPGLKRVMFHLGPAVSPAPADTNDGILTACGELMLSFRGGPGAWSVEEGHYSPGYGALVRNHVLCLESDATSITWSLSLLPGRRFSSNEKEMTKQFR